MPAYNHDLHGNVPDKSGVAVLLIDVLNDLEFPDGDRLLAPALAMAESLARLLKRARRAKIPVIYVNDNFGRWRSDFTQQLAHCLENDVRGRPTDERRAQSEYGSGVLARSETAGGQTKCPGENTNAPRSQGARRIQKTKDGEALEIGAVTTFC